MNNPIGNSRYTRIKNNLGIMPNRITTWQPMPWQSATLAYVARVSYA